MIKLFMFVFFLRALFALADTNRACFLLAFYGGWTPAPCAVPAPAPPKDAESIAARTRAIIDVFEKEEAAKSAAFYKDRILPQIEGHLAALPRMLISGALEPGLAPTVLVDWPQNGTRTMRQKVCALLQDQGFECSEGTNTAMDLFIFWWI
jgi:hypothetical protein